MTAMAFSSRWITEAIFKRFPSSVSDIEILESNGHVYIGVHLRWFSWLALGVWHTHVEYVIERWTFDSCVAGIYYHVSVPWSYGTTPKWMRDRAAVREETEE